MSSSSSCDHNKKRYQYDAFLSFSGEDTRRSFVDHLFEALQHHGIRTFKDDERLQKGKEIKDELLKSIEDSRFSLIVFSKKYASSSWCLDELVKIMECQKKTTDQSTAFPVFYDVEPTEVRHQSGSVGEAFAKHTKKTIVTKSLTRTVGKALARNTSKKIGKWRKALKDAANLSGWELKNIAHGHEAKLIKLIVERISLELRSVNTGVDDNLIGMEPRMLALDPCLEIGSDDVRIIGIKGMGGAGKTTLARAIFDKISIHFEGKSFVENVRENSKAPLLGLKKLQEQVLTDVLKDKCISVSSVHEGTNLMKTMLCGKKVLIVLDDVDHIDQLEVLAGDPSWFKLGSRIIITTRDKQVLIANGVRFIQDVHLLSDEEAIRLFKRHAFREAFPIHEYEIQSLDQVVHYAAGLPLTIKVLGSHLCGKSKLEWEDTLSRLKTIPLKETIMKLEISYDSLEDDYKEIFLDVACFFRNREKDDAVRMLESCGFHAINGLKVLQHKSLINIDEWNWIQMHDHIEEMGKNIVRREHQDEPHKHSRLWVHDEIKHVLANNLGSEATRCIQIEKMDGIVFENLRYMKKLRCLMVPKNWMSYPVIINEAPCNFPNSLQYLCWKEDPQLCLPKTFEANNLVTLEMSHSKIEQLWNEGRVMKKLKFLFLGYTKLKSLDLGLMPRLERLNLEHCDDLVELYVHGGCLKNLVYLNLSSCNKLRSLDLGMMPNLERLNLSYCVNLVKLGMYGGCLKSLVYLNLVYCKNLKSFLFIEHLESLEVLYFGMLVYLDDYPSYIITGQSNNSLLHLHLFGMTNTEEVHPSIGSLHNLVSLCFSNCQRLEIRQERIDGLMHQPKNFSNAIVSICKLKHLKTLILHQCGLPQRSHQSLDQFEYLEKLDLSGYHNFRDTPSSICELKHLKDLNLSGCMRLDKLPGDLEGLKIHRSDVKYQVSQYYDFIQLCFNRSPQIQEFQKLRILDLKRCGIEEVPEALGHLELLEYLNLSYTDVKHLPNSICMLKHLKYLSLQHCVLLEKLPEEIGQLESLEVLYITMCYNIRQIPDSICLLKNLKKLELEGCRRLEMPSRELEDYIFGILA